MYKTVRKGDASLQYTILPQTDQFTSLGYPQLSEKPKPRIVKYTMGTLMIVIILSCIATPFLMNQNDHNLFVSTILAMGRVGHNTMPRNVTRSQTKDLGIGMARTRPVLATMASTEETRGNDTEGTTVPMSRILRTERAEDIFTTDPPTTSTTQRTEIPLVETTTQQTTFSTDTIQSATTSWTTVKPTETTIEDRTASGPAKKPKMLRVTLKLRKNETIPSMFVKAGIASYKKGNITTSVLAHRLSLEGLIFKTPEGTINPWPDKLFFTDASSDFQWKGLNQMPVTIYIVLAGLAALASISIVLMFYVQRKATRRQRQSIEEPEVEGHEEDKSTLLGAESQEAEEKE